MALLLGYDRHFNKYWLLDGYAPATTPGTACVIVEHAHPTGSDKYSCYKNIDDVTPLLTSVEKALYFLKRQRRSRGCTETIDRATLRRNNLQHVPQASINRNLTTRLKRHILSVTKHTPSDAIRVCLLKNVPPFWKVCHLPLPSARCTLLLISHSPIS